MLKKNKLYWIIWKRKILPRSCLNCCGPWPGILTELPSRWYHHINTESVSHWILPPRLFTKTFCLYFMRTTLCYNQRSWVDFSVIIDWNILSCLRSISIKEQIDGCYRQGVSVGKTVEGTQQVQISSYKINHGDVTYRIVIIVNNIVLHI